ncbi:MAG: hypothetical protein DMG44_17835 [Acidobacteria bacterium]|nr:MAG: hypothetical protein DMG44_17835 [Acidobacteriota bacterium]
MPRVVPSQVCRFIASTPVYEFDGIAKMNSIDPAVLSGVLVLADQVPDELLTMDNDAYASFITAKEQIKHVLATWTSNRNAGHSPQGFQFGAPVNPLARIRDALAQCPDESPSPGTSELNFITDPHFRAILRSDIGAVTRALANGEWKAVTVLAGSTIEALLLWDLQTHCAAHIRTAATALVANKTFSKQPPSNPENWVLHHYIEVSAHLNRISKETAIQARLARHFRNLIHPGLALRLRETCDRGTAHSSFAALDHTVRDLTP